MDYHDSLLVLRKVALRRIASPEFASKVEMLQDCKNSIDQAITILKNTDVTSSEHETVEEQKRFVHDTLAAAQETLHIRASDLLRTEVKGTHVSECLYFHDAIGLIEHERVAQVPTFPLRGRKYLSDGKKITSHGSLFCLRAIQMVAVSEFKVHVAREPWCALPRYPNDNEWIILNIMIPGATPVQVISIFSATAEVRDIIRNPALRFDTPAHQQRAMQQIHTMSHEKIAMIKLLKSFWHGDKDYCDERCKMIPTIVEGSWAIKMAVGQKPVMLGKKIEQEYHRGHGYLEIDVNLSTSVIATHILGLVRGVSKDMVVDLGITVQGETEDELPEVILCQARFDHVDLESATFVSSE